MRFLLTAIALSILGAPAPAGPGAEWCHGPDMPGPRDHLGCGVVDGRFVVVGGAYWKDESKRFSAETVAYSPASRKWIQLPSLPRGSAYGASVVYKDGLIVAGGMDDKATLTQCLRLARKQAAYRWERLPDLPYPVAGGKGALVGSKLMIIGGAPAFDEPGLRSASRAVLELDLLHPSKWKEITVGKGFSPRIGAATAVIGDRVYVFGGYGIQPDGSIGNFGDAWSIRGGIWTRIKDVPVKLRWATAVALNSRCIGIFGGYADDFLADAYLYDTQRNTYTRTASMPSPVCNAAGGVIGSTVYLAGGEDQMRHRSAKLFIGAIKP